MYLGNLEENFATLITHLASKNNDANAATATLPLDTLNAKDFLKKELNIECNLEPEITTEDKEEEEESFKTGKQFYKRFWELIEKGAIELVAMKGGATTKGATKDQE